VPGRRSGCWSPGSRCFDGLIVTDALDMGGATVTYPPDVAPVRALLAGADQLLIPPRMDTAYDAVLAAVQSGQISTRRLDASVYRILLHKVRHGLFRSPFVDPDAATGQPTAAAAAQTRLVRALLATGTPVVVAAMRNPYDVASFPEAPTVVDTYGYTAGQVESLVRVLFGEVDPTGLLPVSIPDPDGTGALFEYGHGLGY
jgi:beta-glucosidase-like glycosyl hydrolase